MADVRSVSYTHLDVYKRQAPTGVSLPLSDIEDIVEHNQDVIVIVDEAYVDFGTQSALPLIEKYENLLEMCIRDRFYCGADTRMV